MPRAPLPKAIGCGRQALAEQGRGPDGGGGDGGSGRVCEISELTLGAGLRKPGFPLSGVLGHAPKRALGRDLGQAEAPVPGVGAASFTVWLIILLQVGEGGRMTHQRPRGLARDS